MLAYRPQTMLAIGHPDIHTTAGATAASARTIRCNTIYRSIHWRSSPVSFQLDWRRSSGRWPSLPCASPSPSPRAAFHHPCRPWHRGTALHRCVVLAIRHVILFHLHVRRARRGQRPSIPCASARECPKVQARAVGSINGMPRSRSATPCRTPPTN